MDYSNRFNSKKGAGQIASTEDQNIHTKNRVSELLQSHILDIENDPYVFKNHLGLLECKLCLTTHINEISYISHLSGRKHALNLERRRILDEKYNKNILPNSTTISNIEKRSWNKIGKPQYKITKIRDPDTLQIGILIVVKFPKITVSEPFFRLMSYYELTSKNQNYSKRFIKKFKEGDDEEEQEPNDNQYLIISGEPYENIAIIIPNDKEIEKPNDEFKFNNNYWWYWDNDIKEFYVQILYKN
ncbi:unnamed protein product [Candida verbasci]|uniref:U1-type domain-containing protein n=1 Tax=Candida verbasci TaxID=1227364 RepID=A0A9W4TUI8_9ASCO|nr:unnamed protein product [Candida verbasci]